MTGEAPEVAAAATAAVGNPFSAVIKATPHPLPPRRGFSLSEAASERRHEARLASRIRPLSRAGSDFRPQIVELCFENVADLVPSITNTSRFLFHERKEAVGLIESLRLLRSEVLEFEVT